MGLYVFILMSLAIELTAECHLMAICACLSLWYFPYLFRMKKVMVEYRQKDKYKKEKQKIKFFLLYDVILLIYFFT